MSDCSFLKKGSAPWSYKTADCLCHSGQLLITGSSIFVKEILRICFISTVINHLVFSNSKTSRAVMTREQPKSHKCPMSADNSIFGFIMCCKLEG
jgi:hypothetical protein